MFRIRENVEHAQFLNSKGEWGSWEEAAMFPTQEAATAFVKLHAAVVHYYGLVRTKDWWQ